MTEEERAAEIDPTDAKIAYCRFAGLPPVQIAKTVGLTLPALRQRTKKNRAFYEEFDRFAATIRAKYHTIGGDAEEDPDLWQEGRFLAQQADGQAESEAMLPAGRA